VRSDDFEVAKEFWLPRFRRGRTTARLPSDGKTQNVQVWWQQDEYLPPLRRLTLPPSAA